jgi:hypothetical protein
MSDMHAWGTEVARKTAELERRIEMLETELKNLRRPLP